LYVTATAKHQIFDLGYTDGETPVTVQSWSVPLFQGYKLLYWKSTPHGPNDGLRLFRPN
jgi:hypothetical protein